MAEKKFQQKEKNRETLFRAILSLKTVEECRAFFEDLCTVRELDDMEQRVEAAELLLEGSTYEQIVRQVAISTATISRINRCIRYGSGGYDTVLNRIKAAGSSEETTDGAKIREEK